VGFLSNLLPGARQLRAPLAAGYLWLLAVALASASSLPARNEARGVLQDFFRIGDFVGKVGVALAISFLAYFIGAMSLSVFAAAMRLVSIPVNKVADWGVITLSFTQYRRSVQRKRRTAREGPPAIRDAQPSVPGFSFWKVMIRQGVMDALRVWVFQRFNEIHGPDNPHSGDPRSAVERLGQQVSQETGLMRAELRVKQDDLFAEYDRYQSEQELRSAIVPPLVAVIVVLSVRADGAWALALPAVAVLIRQASISSRQALDVLAAALRLEIIRSPRMDRHAAEVERQRSADASGASADSS
jgi:hypothetical protein